MSTVDSSPLATLIDDVCQTAEFLRSKRTEGDFDSFANALQTAGIRGKLNGSPKDRFYWDRLAPQEPRDLANVKKSSDLATALGLELAAQDVPKAALVYEIIATRVDVLDVQVHPGTHKGGKHGVGHSSHRVHMRNSRTGYNWDTALWKFFNGTAPETLVDNRIKDRMRPLSTALGNEALAAELGELLFRLKMEFPIPSIQQLLAPVLQRGLNGEKIWITGAFCPDYGYEETGDPNLPYRYTFDQLGEGVGLVARQFARVVPQLSDFLTARNIDHEFILGIGDFEADSQETLQRVGVTKTEFHRRCEVSLQAFQQLVGNNYPITLEMCAKNRGEERFRRLQKQATYQMLRGNWGMMPQVYQNADAIIDEIVRDNGTFYKRWYGDSINDEQIRQRVLEQGGEYSSLAFMDIEDYGENVILLSGDRPKMHTFDQLFCNVPVLAVKRAY
jgi:hypothetical protein